MLWRAARIASVSGEPPPAFDRHMPLVNRSMVSGPLTSAKNLSLNQLMQPAHLDARPGLLRQQALSPNSAPSRLVEKFGDDRRRRAPAGWPSSTSTGVVPAGIERQEVAAALPDPLLDQPRARSPYSLSTSRTKRECGQNG